MAGERAAALVHGSGSFQEEIIHIDRVVNDQDGSRSGEFISERESGLIAPGGF